MHRQSRPARGIRIAQQDIALILANSNGKAVTQKIQISAAATLAGSQISFESKCWSNSCARLTRPRNMVSAILDVAFISASILQAGPSPGQIQSQAHSSDRS